MINVKNISKVYYKKKNKIIALDNFSYDFEKYKLYAIMGASGSGKSTLLNIIGLLSFETSLALRDVLPSFAAAIAFFTVSRSV